jgi:hypothetical protein
MRLASAALVARIQERVKSAAYSSTAFILIDEVTGADEYNVPTVTTSTVPVACSFTDKVSNEAWQSFADVQSVDAEIRFDEVIPLKGYRVRIAGRFDGLTMHNKDYEIIGIKDRDAFGYVCALKAVEL